MRAHEAGALHAEVGHRGPAWLRQPADPNALVAAAVVDATSPKADGVLERRRACRLTDLAAEFGTPAYVLDEADFRARARGVPGRLRRLPTSTTPARRSSASTACAGSPRRGSASTSAPAASWPSRCAPASTRPGSASTATTRRYAELRARARGRRRPDHRRLRSTRSSGSRDLAASAASTARVMVRVTAGVEAHTHEYIATAHEDQKFGFSIAGGDAFAAVCRLDRRPGIARAARPALATSARRSSTPPASRSPPGGCSALHAADLRRARRRAARARPRRRLRHRLHHPGRPGRARRSWPTEMRQDRRARVPGARRRRAAAVDRAGPRDRRARRRSRSTRSARSRRSRSTAAPAACYVVGRRRDERQHPHRALRRRLLLHARLARLRRRAGARPGRRQALRVRRHRGQGRVPARRRRARRPARGARRPAPTAGRWPATTTTCRGRRWSRCGTGSRAVVVRRETEDDLLRLDVGLETRVVSEADERAAEVRSKVALLGCGARCGVAQVVRLLTEQADDLAARVGAPLELVGIAVRRLDAPREVDVPARAVHHRRRRPGHARRRRRRHRGDRRHRAGPVADPGRARSTAPRSSRPTRRCSPRTAPTLFEAADEGRPRPLLRGVRRRRDPDPAAAARVAGRRPGHPGARHRQRHHQLHPRPDGHAPAPASPRRSRRPRSSATPRPTRPPTSRASTPPPRPRSWPAWPSTPGSPPPTCTARASAEVTAADVASAREMGSVVKLLAICERDEPTARSASARAPGDDPAHPPAGQRPRGVQRGLRRERGGRPADVLRPRRRRRADRERGARRPGHGGPQPARGRAAAPASRRTPTARCCRWARPSPATTSRIDVDDRPACWPRSPTLFAEHGVSIQTVRRRAAATTRSWSWSPTGHRRRAGGDRRGAAGDGDRPRGHLGDAGRRRVERMSSAAAHQWRGVIEEYRDWLPVADEHPGRHARRGRHPAGRAPAGCRSVTGCEVWLKVEGDNPTGSFKDRGMTVAISVAVDEGAKAVVCASTGNTSASMAAYAAPGRADAARAGPAGQDRRRQDGAGDHARRPRSSGPRQLRRLPAARRASLAEDYPVALVNSVNPVRLEGQKTAAFEIVDRARRRPRLPPAAGRQRRQHLGVLAGLPRVRRRSATPPAAR